MLSRLEPCFVDLRDKPAVLKYTKKIKPDIIFHTASYGGHTSQRNRREAIETNFLGTVNLIEASNSVDYELFVNTGSSSEYGIKKSRIRENEPLAPVTAYGISKALATLYALEIAGKENRPIVTLRLFTPYGYYDDRERLVTSAINCCLKNKPLKLSSPSAVRDFVFIEDVLDAYEKAYRNKDKIKGQIFNIAFGKQYSVAEVVNRVIKFTETDTPALWGKIRNPRLEPRLWLADITKANKLLGWYPKYDLSKGLKKTIQWLKNNPHLYQ